MQIDVINYNEIKSLSGLQPDGWSNIIDSFEFYTTSLFCFPIKVTIDNTIVGIGCAIIHNDVAWLAHIIVHMEFRNRGIGKLITQYLVDCTKSHNCQTVYLIATELGAAVYQKIGFDTETEYLFFKDITIEDNLPVSEKIICYRSEFKKQITEIDREISTEDRMFHVKNYLENGFVYNRNSIIEGFYLPAFGEGLILANNFLAGLNLFKMHIKSKNKAVVPIDNISIINYLYDNGFKEWSRAKRMRLGVKRPVKFENIYNRIGGNLG